MNRLRRVRAPLARGARRRPWLYQPRLERLEERNLLTPANVLVNNVAEDTTVQDTQSETALAVAPNGNIIVAYNDTEENAGGAPHYTGYSFSTDANTFTDQGALPNAGGGDSGVPTLAVSNLSGSVYLTTRTLTGSPALQFFTSSDNGVTFGAPINSAPGFPANHFLDRPSLAVDNFPGPGQGNIYQTFTDFIKVPGFTNNGVYLNRSTNGGSSFMPDDGTHIAPPTMDQAVDTVNGSDVVVGPDHSVYVFLFEQKNGLDRLDMAKSTDFGQTFNVPGGIVNLMTKAANGNLGLNGGFRTNAFPHAAVNPVTGALYVTYDDRGLGRDRADIYFIQSNDGGITWTPPQRINDDSTTNDQWQPAITVTPDGTKVFIAWYDRRLSADNTMIDRFGTIGDVIGGTVFFRPNFRITDTSFPVVVNQDPTVPATYMGDYDQAAATNSFFYTTWGDNRLADPAHAHNPDVRFAAVPVNTAAAAAVSRPGLAAALDAAFTFPTPAAGGVNRPAPAAAGPSLPSFTQASRRPDDQIFFLDQYWQSAFMAFPA
jgi:hypothetical protein